MVKVIDRLVTLRNGVKMPLVGLGTYKITGEECKTAIPEAVKCGYKLIDTATIYRNEEAIGEVLSLFLKSNSVKRESLFLESKLATFDQGYESTLKAVEVSCRKLQTNYIDLYIIHWPGAAKLDPKDVKNAELRRDSWRALEELYEKGTVKAIGVSNYTEAHLEEMKSYAKVLPMVNQIELHPLYYPRDTVKWCRDHGVIVQAYSSLARGEFTKRPELLEPIMAKYKDKSIAQILLKWAIQHDFCVIPKSVTPARIKENAELDFELDEDSVNYLDSISLQETVKTCWDPVTVR